MNNQNFSGMYDTISQVSAFLDTTLDTTQATPKQLLEEIDKAKALLVRLDTHKKDLSTTNPGDPQVSIEENLENLKKIKTEIEAIEL